MEFFLLLLAFLAFNCLLSLQDHYKMRRIARERGHPDICAYARSFDFRNTDTKIMRSVYTEMQEWAGVYDGVPFPVQASDNIDDIYNMHPEDLEEMVIEIIEEHDRSFDNYQKNPYYNTMHTVKDLVLFIDHQPKLNAA